MALRSAPVSPWLIFVVCTFLPYTSVATAGQTIFNSQTRFVSGAAFADDGVDPVSDSDLDESPDFGPFNGAASASADIPDIALGTGGGTQDSTLMFSGFTAGGSAFATAESFDRATTDGSGFSRFCVQFELSTEADFTLQGSIGAFDSGLTFISLRDRAIEVFGATAVGPATRLPINEAGTLPPGSYTLEIESSGSAFADPFAFEFAFAEFDLSFNVAVEPAVPTLGQWGLLIFATALVGGGTTVLRRRREAHASSAPCDAIC